MPGTPIGQARHTSDRAVIPLDTNIRLRKNQGESLSPNLTNRNRKLFPGNYHVIDANPAQAYDIDNSDVRVGSHGLDFETQVRPLF